MEGLVKNHLLNSHHNMDKNFQLTNGNSNKQKTINQDSDSANSHGYSPYRNKSEKFVERQQKKRVKPMFCKRAFQKGLEVLMTMVSLFEFETTKNTENLLCHFQIVCSSFHGPFHMEICVVTSTKNSNQP